MYNCTLMHKDIKVVDLVLDEESCYIETIGTIHELDHLPLGTTWKKDTSSNPINRGLLNDWWLQRSIPASRDNIIEALDTLHLDSPRKLLLKCYGLSLSDHYWMKPSHMNLQWKGVNFFDNAFSTDIGEVLFGKEIDNLCDINMMSPDNTSDGWLKKKWVIIDQKRVLVKGGSGRDQQEPFNELIACAIMRRLRINHVPYTLIFENQKPFCLCDNFLTTHTELISAWRILQTHKQDNRDSEYQHLYKCCNTLGIKDYTQEIDQMLVLDYLIANTDRHYNNFGFIRNAETLEWLGFAPIYDSGTSLWHNDPIIVRNPKSKPFRKYHDSQIELVSTFDWLNIKLLDGIEEESKDILLQSPFLDAKRINNISQGIKNRVTKLEQYIISQNMTKNL